QPRLRVTRDTGRAGDRAREPHLDHVFTGRALAGVEIVGRGQWAAFSLTRAHEERIQQSGAERSGAYHDVQQVAAQTIACQVTQARQWIARTPGHVRVQEQLFDDLNAARTRVRVTVELETAGAVTVVVVLEVELAADAQDLTVVSRSAVDDPGHAV